MMSAAKQLAMEVRTCAACGKLFTPARLNAISCSAACVPEARRIRSAAWTRAAHANIAVREVHLGLPDLERIRLVKRIRDAIASGDEHWQLRERFGPGYRTTSQTRIPGDE